MQSTIHDVLPQFMLHRSNSCPQVNSFFIKSSLQKEYIALSCIKNKKHSLSTVFFILVFFCCQSVLIGSQCWCCINSLILLRHLSECRFRRFRIWNNLFETYRAFSQSRSVLNLSRLVTHVVCDTGSLVTETRVFR